MKNIDEDDTAFNYDCYCTCTQKREKKKLNIFVGNVRLLLLIIIIVKYAIVISCLSFFVVGSLVLLFIPSKIDALCF